MTGDDLRLHGDAGLFWDQDARGGGHHRQERAGPQKERRRSCWPRPFGSCHTARDMAAAIEAAGCAIAGQRRAWVAPLPFVNAVAPLTPSRARRP